MKENYMNKIFYLFIILIFISSCFQLPAQYDARRLPEYLDITKENLPVFSSRAKKVYYNDFPPEAFAKYKGPAKILTDNGIQIINLSGGYNNQSETWITINPLNPDNIVAAANDYNYLTVQTGYRMSTYSTSDGFKTWTHSTTPDNNGLYINIPSGRDLLLYDPGLTFDTHGWCYYSYGVSQIDAQQKDYDNGLFVCRSKDGGKSWEDPIPIALSTAGTLNQEFNDRYSIAADCNHGSPYQDNIYLTWKKFNKNTGIAFSKSTDAGQTWSIPSSLPGGDINQTQSPIPVVGPNNELYVVWISQNNGYADAYVQKSTNGGATWLPGPSKAQSILSNGVLNTVSYRYVLENKQNMRIASMPYIAVDNSNGPRKGYVYIVQTGLDETGKTRLFLSKSTNGGVDWTSKIRIDSNQYGNDMFFPNIAVDPVTGIIAVIYYSSQNDLNNVGFDAYLAVSSDGVNFRNIRLTPQMIYVNNSSDIVGDNGNFYWGDYTSVTAYNGKIYPCWWMPSGYNTQFYTNDVYVAPLSTEPKPPTNLTAGSDYHTPNRVTLKWTDPVTNQLGDNLTDFKIVVSRNDVEISQINKGLQTYNDDNAVDGTQYTYSIKARLANGMESPSISVSLFAGGALKPFPPTAIAARPVKNGVLLSWTNPYYHTDSTFFSDFNRIDIYVDSVKTDSVTSNIQAGEISSVQLNLTPKKFYLITLKAVGKRGKIETESDFSNVSVAYAGEPFTELYDNFDDTPDTVARYTNQGWGLTQIKAVSPPNALTDSPIGNYANNATNYVYFPPVILSQTMKTLGFEEIAIIQTGGDAGIVWLSSDFGVTWNSLVSVSSNRSSGFTDNVSTSSWYSERIGIDKYVGDTVMLAFELYSNNFNNKDGWYIDNLKIDDSPALVDYAGYFSSGMTLNAVPNPVLNSVKIEFTLPLPGDVVISLYDIMGNQVKNIHKGRLSPGEYSYVTDMSNLADGVYYCKVNAGNASKTIPIIVSK
jgi:hypothetical protein